MATVAMSDEEILELVKSLPPEKKYATLVSFAESAQQKKELMFQRAEARMHDVAKRRGFVWEELSEEERIELVNDLVHELHGR